MRSDVERAVRRDADARAVRRAEGCRATPLRIRTPLGRPSFQLKRSPLTPAMVAVDVSRFCIAVTFSRPAIDSFESTGWSE